MARRAVRPRVDRARGERGDVAVLFVFPVAVTAILLCAHTALVFHGRSVVAGAAQDALRAAQIEGGSAQEARTAADGLLAVAPGLRNRNVAVGYADGGDTITVTVTADVVSVLPGLLDNVRSVATGPRERFYAEPERR